MAALLLLSSRTLNSIICLLLLATSSATSARILDDVTQQIPVPVPVRDPSEPVAPPETDIPDAAQPVATTPSTNVAQVPDPSSAPAEPAPVISPVPDILNTETPPPPLATSVASVTTPGAAQPATKPTTTTPSTNVAHVPDTSSAPAEPAPVIAPVPDILNTETPPLATSVAPVTTPAATTPSGGAATSTSTNPTTAGTDNVISDHPTLSFFMHDILGGSHPSGRAVTGIVANSDANNLPFSKPNNQIFPINGGVPLNTINGIINNNNYPFLVGLNGSPTNTLIQSNGNNVVAGNNQPFVTAGQLPAGLTLQQLMFGSVTVVDNEITEGHELGSSVLGRAQGFYLTSSSDGSSHTLALTVVFHGGDHHDEILDTVSFFGVHRTATPISHIAIIGGTGKYENSKGYATIETLPHEDQHTTDGLETITHFTLYLAP